MNVRQTTESERLAIRYHQCPVCDQPPRTWCRAIPMPGNRADRLWFLRYPHEARVALVAEGETWLPRQPPRCRHCGKGEAAGPLVDDEVRQPPPDINAARQGGEPWYVHDYCDQLYHYHIREMVADAPPLSVEKAEEIARLLGFRDKGRCQQCHGSGFSSSNGEPPIECFVCGGSGRTDTPPTPKLPRKPSRAAVQRSLAVAERRAAELRNQLADLDADSPRSVL